MTWPTGGGLRGRCNQKGKKRVKQDRQRGWGASTGSLMWKLRGALIGKPMVDNVRPHHGITIWDAPLAGASDQRRPSWKTSTPRSKKRANRKKRSLLAKKKNTTQGGKHRWFRQGHRARGKRDHQSHTEVRKHHGSSVRTKRRQDTPAVESRSEPTKTNPRRAAEKQNKRGHKFKCKTTSLSRSPKKTKSAILKAAKKTDGIPLLKNTVMDPQGHTDIERGYMGEPRCGNNDSTDR